jgi:hypothetical protein
MRIWPLREQSLVDQARDLDRHVSGGNMQVVSDRPQCLIAAALQIPDGKQD